MMNMGTGPSLLQAAEPRETQPRCSKYCTINDGRTIEDPVQTHLKRPMLDAKRTSAALLVLVMIR